RWVRSTVTFLGLTYHDGVHVRTTMGSQGQVSKARKPPSALRSRAIVAARRLSDPVHRDCTDSTPSAAPTDNGLITDSRVREGTRGDERGSRVADAYYARGTGGTGGDHRGRGR